MPKTLLHLVVIGIVIVGGFWILKDRDAVTSTESESGYIDLRLGETGSAGGVAITPLELLEDSRCPGDVQCIQAGTVRVSAKLVGGFKISRQTLTFGETRATEVGRITLTTVLPAPNAETAVEDADYRFTFKVEDRSPFAPPPPP